MITEALKFLRDHLAPIPEPQTIHRTQRTEQILYYPGAGQPAQIVKFDSPAAARSHKFSSVAAILAFLSDEITDGPLIGEDGVAEPRSAVFVAPNQIHARINYNDTDEVIHEARCPLTPHASAVALSQLAAGVSQRKLWTLLNTDLWQRVSADLLLQIAAITVRAGNDIDSRISTVGLVNKKDASYYNLEIDPGKATEGVTNQQLGVEWTIDVRLWNEADFTYPVETRLELQPADDGLRFTFFPRNLEDIQRQALIDLAAHVRAGLDPKHYRVYDGQY